MAKKTDEKTLSLIREVAKRKEEISQIERPNWKTNCSFAYDNNSSPINIHVVTDIDVLIQIAAFLLKQEEYYNDAVIRLGIESVQTFLWRGFTASEWLSDIKTRIDKIQIASKKKSLETLEARLNAIISPDLRAELELEAIASALGA